jgi:hypothetical protein
VKNAAMPLIEAHLTENQLDDAMIELAGLAPAVAAHLADCAVCTARLREAQAPIAAFGSVSLAWSERRSATLPAQPVFARTAWRLPASAAAMCAAAMAIVVALPTLHHRADATAGVAPAPTAQAQVQAQVQPASIAVPSMAATPAAYTASDADSSLSPDDAQISRDNRMLRTIDRELEASAATPTALDTDMGLQPEADTTLHTSGSILD